MQRNVIIFTNTLRRICYGLLASISALLLAACGTGAAALRDETTVQAGALRITNVWMRAPNPASTVDAVYMVIRNTGSQEEQLLGATSDAAAIVELHQSTAPRAGVVAMQPVKAITIPAGGAVAIESGVYHLMLTQRTRMVKAGEKIALTLQFANAGAVALQADVRDAAPESGGGSGGAGEHQH